MESLKVRDKEYKPRFISLMIFKKVLPLEKKMTDAEAKFEESPELFEKAWMDYCGAILEGDVSGLSASLLEPWEMYEVRDFFVNVFTEATQKPGSKTSEGSTLSPQ